MEEESKSKPKNIIDTAMNLNRKSDELWRKFVIWIWIAGGVYIVYLVIAYLFGKIGL